MSYACRALAVGDVVVDTNTKCSASESKALYDAGVRGIIRYVPLPGNNPANDVDAVELAIHTAQGHTVVVVQHPRSPANNTLSAETGAGDAAHAVAYCQSIGYVPSPKATIALDMEGLKNPGPGSFAHARCWVVAILAATYSALVYVGYDSGLTSAQCDELAALGADVVFWCDAGPYSARPAPSKKYCMKQHMQSTLAGVGVDHDDVLQGGVVWGLCAAVDVEPTFDGDPAADVTQPIATIPVPDFAHHDTEPPPAA